MRCYVLQEGRDANVASYGLVTGACGFGYLNRSSWPYWNAVAIPRSSPIAQSGLAGKDGCGACIRITCTQNVRAWPAPGFRACLEPKRSTCVGLCLYSAGPY